MRTIYLIRHGKPEFPDERKYCIGRTDLPLSEEGRTQIRALGETFAGRRIEKIYTSPLKRCRESAAILQEVIDRSIPIEVLTQRVDVDLVALSREVHSFFLSHLRRLSSIQN